MGRISVLKQRRREFAKLGGRGNKRKYITDEQITGQQLGSPATLPTASTIYFESTRSERLATTTQFPVIPQMGRISAFRQRRRDLGRLGALSKKRNRTEYEQLPGLSPTLPTVTMGRISDVNRRRRELCRLASNASRRKSKNSDGTPATVPTASELYFKSTRSEGEQNELKASNQVHKAVDLNNASDKSFCLLCSKETTHTISCLKNYNVNKGEADFLAMFILKKMLNVPSENLVQYLGALGHPCDWISICDHCALLVLEAFAVQKKICELELQLRKCQRKMKETISKTYQENQVRGHSIDDRYSTALASLVVTKRTRHYVASSESYLKSVRLSPKSSTCINDDIAPASFRQESVSFPKENTTVLQSTDFYSDDYGDDGMMDVDTGDTMIPLISPEARNITDKAPSVNQTCVNVVISSNKDEITKGAAIANTETGDPKTDTLSGSDMRIAYKHKKFKSDNTVEDPLYGCVLCPNLKPMRLHPYVTHLVFHYDRPYKCTECNGYSSGSDIELAIQSAASQDSNHHTCTKDTLVKVKLETDKIWECGYCSSSFNLETQRESHEIIAHSKEKFIRPKYVCSKCPKKLRDYHEWRIHRALEHPSFSKVACFYCDAIFKRRTKDVDVEDVPDRNRHIKNKHGLNNYHLYECRICGISFSSSIIQLRDHMEKEHAVDRNETLSCPICFKSFKERHTLESHIRAVHEKESREKFVCDVCAHSTFRLEKMLEHKLLKHGTDTSERPVLNCSKENCSFKCIKKTTLEVHMVKAHCEDRKYKCDVCGKAFFKECYLQRHSAIHQNSGNRPFQCEICGNSFAVRNYLYIHMRLSHQNRPFASTHKKKPSRKKKLAVGQKVSSEDSQPSASTPPTNTSSLAPAPSSEKTELTSAL